VFLDSVKEIRDRRKEQHYYIENFIMVDREGQPYFK
jgi:hypothetical protein